MDKEKKINLKCNNELFKEIKILDENKEDITEKVIREKNSTKNILL